MTHLAIGGLIAAMLVGVYGPQVEWWLFLLSSGLLGVALTLLVHAPSRFLVISRTGTTSIATRSVLGLTIAFVLSGGLFGSVSWFLQWLLIEPVDDWWQIYTVCGVLGVIQIRIRYLLLSLQQDGVDSTRWYGPMSAFVGIGSAVLDFIVYAVVLGSVSAVILFVSSPSIAVLWHCCAVAGGLGCAASVRHSFFTAKIFQHAALHHEQTIGSIGWLRFLARYAGAQAIQFFLYSTVLGTTLWVEFWLAGVLLE